MRQLLNILLIAVVSTLWACGPGARRGAAVDDATAARADSAVTLTVYFERSGSMVPYDSRDGGGQLKKTVNDMINRFPGDSVTINIVNDDIYPYTGDLESFLHDRDIYATTAGTGNASYTDFGRIFSRILEQQDSGNVSIVVTDLIYSPADMSEVSLEKIFNEENSLATAVFKRYKGKSVVVNRFMGDYHGRYYPALGGSFDYHGPRPYYVLLVADAAVLDRLTAVAPGFVHPDGVTASYRFNQGTREVEHVVLPDWRDNAGRWRAGRGGQAALTHVEADRATGLLCLTVAARLDVLDLGDDVLCDSTRYRVESLSGFTLSVRPVTPDMVTGNNRDYLAGKTHLLTLRGTFKGPRDRVRVALPNTFPQWVVEATSGDDSNPAAPRFATTTLGLERFLAGLYDAFNTGGDYFAIDLDLRQ